MTTELLPSFSTKILPATPQPQSLEPGTVQGVHFVMPQEEQDWILEKIEQWFSARDDVVLLDYGISDKRGIGYIIMEWEEYEVDPLFIAILEHEDIVGDYTVYIRDVEV